MPEGDDIGGKRETQLPGVTPEGARTSIGHERHCFVVMPSGREPSEQKWFRGWYEVVIKPAVVEAGYEPILAAAEEQPGAINDEIRTHLALDTMIVVDLGGAEPEDDPNPNVMYELGIRHALGLPLVIMAWKGQRLPFDVSNQRAIMEDRDLIDLDPNRRKLVSFIRAAEQGKYYRPMDAVSRQATIQAASESLAEDSVLRALAQEVRDLRATVTSGLQHRERIYRRPHVYTVKRLIQGRVYRKELYAHFAAHGGDPSVWARVLRTPLEGEALETARKWGVDEWKAYVAAQAAEHGRPAVPEPFGGPQELSGIEEEMVQEVRALLPTQPWPVGIHKEIAGKLGITNSQASKCINKLIRRGEFKHQSDGAPLPEDGG